MGAASQEGAPKMNSAERHRLKQLEKRRKKKAAKKKKKQEQKKDGGLQKESADLVGLIRKQESVSAGVKKEGEQETQEKSTEKEVEYVVEDVSSNPMFAQFKDILGKFANPLEMKKAREEELKERERVDALEAAGVDPSAAAQSTDTQQNGKEKASEGGDGDEDDEDDEDKVLSNKERKRLSRMSIAELKQMVTKPEVVELHDVNSHEPELLVQLKSYRNTVPVPGHWLQKRAYLTMKRGMEVRPFELPQFIEDTGISEIRTMQNDRDRDKTAAQRNKEKMNPKMGRIDIDYEVLHAAFFRYQTKPRMTSHGDLYFEGKEFSVKMSDHRPGQLSDELKRALGMNDELTPPPWLRNMQRYGPPPSYPNLKIAGINTPIPAGARYGFDEGEWGKPPIDDFGRPIYGDVFGVEATAADAADEETELWGQMAESDDESSSEEEESDEEEDSDADLLDEEATDMSGIDSTISHVSGLTTPGMMQIRKGGDRGMETPTGAPRALYQVMEQKKVELGNGFFGTDYSYVLPTEQEQQQQQATDILAGKASSSSSRRSAKDQVAVALNPEELAGLDAVTLKRKYESQLALQKNLQNAESAQRRADIDEVFEENRKKRKLEKGGGKFKNVF